MGGIVSGIGGLVGGLLGGNSAPSAPNVNVYQPGGTSSIDSQLQALLSSNSNLVGANNPYNSYAPQFAALYNQIYNNPYASGAQSAANTGGTSYSNVGTGGVNTSGAINSAINPALSGAQSVLNMGLDPQSALYAQLAQKVTDQANVTNAQYGLTGQQAASSVNQANTNFNIDWQNQELTRALAGLSGYNSTLGAAGQAGTAAQNIGSAGAGAQVQGGNVPYQQSVGNTQNQSTALQQYIQALLGPQTSSESTIADLGSYLGQGIGASEAGQQAALQAYQAQLTGGGLGAIGGAGLANNLFSGGNASSLFSFLNPSTTASFAGPIGWGGDVASGFEAAAPFLGF